MKLIPIKLFLSRLLPARLLPSRTVVTVFMLSIVPTCLLSGQDIVPDQEPADNGQQELPAPDDEQLTPTRPIASLDESLASWYGADSVTGRVGKVIRANWVMLGESGSLAGKVVGLDDIGAFDLNVYALRNGIVVGQTMTNRNGHFKIEGLKQGTYTLVGYHPSALFFYGVNAVGYRSSAKNLPTTILTKAIANTADKFAVGTLVERAAPKVRFRTYGKYQSGEDESSNAPRFGWIGLSKFDVEGVPANSLASQQIRLQPNGRFGGRIHQIHYQDGRPVGVQQTKVVLLSAGQVVKETGCDRFGIFEFANVSPGEYGLLAYGADGLAAIGLELVPANSKANNFKVGDVDLTLVQPEAIGWINHHLLKQRFDEDRAMPRPGADRGYGQFEQQRCQSCYRVYVNARPVCRCGR